MEPTDDCRCITCCNKTTAHTLELTVTADVRSEACLQQWCKDGITHESSCCQHAVVKAINAQQYLACCWNAAACCSACIGGSGGWLDLGLGAAGLGAGAGARAALLSAPDAGAAWLPGPAAKPPKNAGAAWPLAAAPAAPLPPNAGTDWLLALAAVAAARCNAGDGAAAMGELATPPKATCHTAGWH